MFQSTDEINIDENLFNDVFDIPNKNNGENKRNLDVRIDEPVKKVCTKTSKNEASNIISILKSNSSQSNKPILNISEPISNNPIIPKRNTRVVQRKFPGPAGILPEKIGFNFDLNQLDEFNKNKSLVCDEIVCSQYSEDVFKKQCWSKMLADWSTSSKENLVEKYTISWIKLKALEKQLINQKTPFLAAVIQDIECSTKDPMLLLKDKTGEIQASLLNEVWENYCDYLIPGSVIVLKQTSVLSTLKRNYLAITLNNIITIYTEQENENQSLTVEVIQIQDITIDDLINSIEKIKKDYKNQQIMQQINKVNNVSDNPYIKTINSTHQLEQKCPETFNVPKPPPKFNFKAKINSNHTKTNETMSSTSKEIPKNNEEEMILSQVLDGVDTNSLFEDF